MSALDGIPYGWTFVPIEANDDMCNAGVAEIEKILAGEGAPFRFPDAEHLYDIFRAMKNASPKLTEEEIQSWTGNINVDEKLFRFIESMSNIQEIALDKISECAELRYENGLLSERIKTLEEKISQMNSDNLWTINADRQGGA